MSTYLTRRQFFFALAASAVAAGVPLPTGMPAEVPDVQIFDADDVVWTAYGGDLSVVRYAVVYWEGSEACD